MVLIPAVRCDDGKDKKPIVSPMGFLMQQKEKIDEKIIYIREIGYTDAALGFASDSCEIIQSIDEQSPDIALGVDKVLDQINQTMQK